MTEDEKEDLIHALCDEFMSATPSATEEHKFGFLVGARSAIVELQNRGILAPPNN